EETEAHLLVRPLDEFVRAVVEDADLAGAVVAFGDRALEAAVLEWMVLRPNGQPPVAEGEGEPSRHGPRGQRAVLLQPKVVVEPGGPVLLDHERVPRALRHSRGRLRGALEVSLGGGFGKLRG